MERREGDRRFQLHQDRIINQTMLSELWASMNNSMPDRVGRRHSGVARRLPMRMIASRWLGMGRVSDKQYVSARIFCAALTAFVTDRFGFAGDQFFDP